MAFKQTDHRFGIVIFPGPQKRFHSPASFDPELINGFSHRQFRVENDAQYFERRSIWELAVQDM